MDLHCNALKKGELLLKGEIRALDWMHEISLFIWAPISTSRYDTYWSWRRNTQLLNVHINSELTKLGIKNHAQQKVFLD